MKTAGCLTCIILIFFLFVSCSSNDQNTKDRELKKESISESAQEPKKGKSRPDSVRFKRLIIQGQNIWLRDKQAVGEVILKLNTGDTCEILEIGKFEIINGEADFWYQVKYEGQEAWVFGSQTNIALGLNEPKTPEDVWFTFKEAHKIWCRRYTEYFTDETERDRGIMCRLSDKTEEGLSLELPCDECAKRITYVKGKYGPDRLIIRGREFLGGAMGCYEIISKQAFRDDEKWNLRVFNDLAGRVDTSFIVSPGREFTAVITKRDCGVIGNYRLAIYETKRSRQTESVKMQELYSQDWNRQNGLPYVDSVSTEYEFSGDTLSLILTKFRKDSNGSDLDDLSIRFRWDASTDNFVSY